MKSICFVIHNIQCGGGTERVGLCVANALCARGYRVSFISYEAKAPSFFPVDPRIVQGKMLSNILERRTRDRWPWYASWKLRRFLKRNEVDVVIDIDAVHALWTWPAIRGTGIKWISWDHFYFGHTMGEFRRIKAFQLVAQHADRLVLISKEDLHTYLCESGLPAAKIAQIYNPLSFECDSYEQRTAKKVISIGRIAFQKGFDLLLKAWQTVEQNDAEWELEIVCGYGDPAALQREAEGMGLRRVTCLPPTKDVCGRMQQAGLYALPSRFEGFGLVLTEAATAGLPSVAFNCPYGPSEIVDDGKTGYLVPPEDTATFARRLLEMMHNDDLRYQMGHNAFEAAKRFSLSRIIPQWEELIESL